MNILELTQNPLFFQWSADLSADRYPQADGAEKLDCCSFELTASYNSADDMHSLQVQVTNIGATVKDGEIVSIKAPLNFDDNTFVTVVGLNDDTNLCDGLCLSEIDDMDLANEIKDIIFNMSDILYPMASDWETVKSLHREQW